MLIDKVEVRSHNLYGFSCRGLFAKEKIKVRPPCIETSVGAACRLSDWLPVPGLKQAGEVIWKFEKSTELLRVYHKKDIDAVTDEKEKETLIMYSYMLDDDTYGSTPDPDEDTSYFFNHSCDPNCWYDTDDLIVAMRDIEAGEHVVYDYAFTETEGSLHAGLACKCGSACCRGVLTFSDWRSHAWREKYKGHVTSYLERRMEEACYVDPRVVLRHKAGGEKGLFATADMKRGEVVLIFTGKVVGLQELMAVGPRCMELSLQVRLLGLVMMQRDRSTGIATDRSLLFSSV